MGVGHLSKVGSNKYIKSEWQLKGLFFTNGCRLSVITFSKEVVIQRKILCRESDYQSFLRGPLFSSLIHASNLFMFDL